MTLFTVSSKAFDNDSCVPDAENPARFLSVHCFISRKLLFQLQHHFPLSLCLATSETLSSPTSSCPSSSNDLVCCSWSSATIYVSCSYLTIHLPTFILFDLLVTPQSFFFSLHPSFLCNASELHQALPWATSRHSPS